MWSHELKLHRASRHFEELKLEVERWLHVDGCAVVVEPGPKEPFYVVRAERLRELDRDDISLRIGDVLQNARASLDYLAHELGEIGARTQYGREMTTEESEQSGFPIVGDVDAEGFEGVGLDRFRQRVAADLRTLSPEAVAFIESVQPFQDKGVWAWNDLWLLHELARIDRHRTLPVTVVRSGGLTRDTSRWSNCRVKNLEIGKGRVNFSGDEPGGHEGAEDSAVLATFEGRPSRPGKEMHMHFLNALELGWDEDIPADLPSWRNVMDMLDGILFTIRSDVFWNARKLLIEPEPEEPPDPSPDLDVNDS